MRAPQRRVRPCAFGTNTSGLTRFDAPPDCIKRYSTGERIVNLLNSATPNFAQFPLSSPMPAAIETAGYRTPTPIQAETIDAVLAGHDVIGTAQTRTGKAAAFIIRD